MKQHSPSSVSGADISPRDVVNAMLGADNELDQFSEQPSHPLGRDHAFTNILADVETSGLGTAESFTRLNERLDALCEKFAKGFDGPPHAEEKLGEGPPEEVAEKIVDQVDASAGKPDDALKAALERPIEVASLSTASNAGDRPFAPVITRLENSIADLADQIAAYEAAQEDLRKFVQNGFDGLAHRIDAAKRASEAAAQRAQNQAVRLAQEELRKFAQSEFGKLAQRIEATRQVSEAAARRAQDQAVRMAQEELRKLVQSEFGRLGQRMDVLKQASEAAAQRAQDQAMRMAQEEMRKLVQSEFGRHDQRMDGLIQASEAAAQRAQNQAVRLAQEEVRKHVQGELGQFAQRIDAWSQASEAAAQRAQNQAVQQAQKDLRDLESRMQAALKKHHGDAQDDDKIGHLRVEVESLGQRVDDLTVKAVSEHELGSLRVAIERLSARVAQGPDLKPLADFDRRLTEVTNKLEQRLTHHTGGQIGAADVDKRIAAAMRQNQISPPWSAIERKLTGISDRLANTETGLQDIATHEKWILQLFKGLEESLDWSRNVAEDAATRMASRLVQEWSGKADPATTPAETGGMPAMSPSPASSFASRAAERSTSSRMSLSTPRTAEPRTIAGALSSPAGRAR